LVSDKSINCTFPLPARINGKSIEDHGQASETAVSGFGLCLEVGNQLIKAFHGSIVNGFKKKFLKFKNKEKLSKKRIPVKNYHVHSFLLLSYERNLTL